VQLLHDFIWLATASTGDFQESFAGHRLSTPSIAVPRYVATDMCKSGPLTMLRT